MLTSDYQILGIVKNHQPISVSNLIKCLSLIEKNKSEKELSFKVNSLIKRELILNVNSILTLTRKGLEVLYCNELYA